MALSPYMCANCGFWQRHFAPPPWCPVCIDVRNALPDDGWSFLTPEDLAGRVTCHWRDCGDGLHEFWCEPRTGLDSHGFVLARPGGNVSFEAAPFYDASALARIDDLGGITTAAASHPHGYGALWQLQDRFEPDVAIAGADHAWTKAFRVTWPFDDTTELAPGLSLHVTAGHFDGHTVLHDADHRWLFAGDSVKFDVDDDGRPVAVGCHKAWHQRTPLTVGELRRYRTVLAPLEADAVASPFGMTRGATTAQIIEVIDVLLTRRPTIEAFPIVDGLVRPDSLTEVPT